MKIILTPDTARRLVQHSDATRQSVDRIVEEAVVKYLADLGDMITLNNPSSPMEATVSGCVFLKSDTDVGEGAV